MNITKPILKWVGGKIHLSEEIIEVFPKKINRHEFNSRMIELYLSMQSYQDMLIAEITQSAIPDYYSRVYKYKLYNLNTYNPVYKLQEILWKSPETTGFSLFRYLSFTLI